MDIKEFHIKMKQHCEHLEGECSKCRFLEYCYSQARDIHIDFLEQVMYRLSAYEESNKDIFSRVIRNHHNVFRP